MGKALIAAAVLFAGCGMYTQKADPLKTPAKNERARRLALEAEGREPVAGVTYVEECDVNFSQPPTQRRDKKAASTQIARADADLQNAETSKSPAAQRTVLVRQAIETYSDALRKDPYNAEATLKLALGYDRVLRKGCALAMLRRLGDLAGHPSLGSDAKLQAGLVHQNPHWFKGYRKDAIRLLP